MSRSLRLGVLVLFVAGCSGKTESTDKKPPEDTTDPKIKTVRADLEALTQQCERFYLNNQRWPESLDQLVKPPKGEAPYVKETAFADPWGQEYAYDPAGPRNGGKKPDIWTMMPPDWKEIGNWQK